MITDASNTALLSYSVTTDPEPLQASPASGRPLYGALTIVVSNNTEKPIFCEQIPFLLPIGDLAQDLTSVPTGILCAAVPSANWQLSQTSERAFTAFPLTEEHKKITSDGLVFQIYSIVVNDEVGTFTLTVQETSSTSGTDFQVRTGGFDLAKFPYGYFFGGLAPSAPQVPYRGQVTLTWTGSDGPEYTMFAGTQAYNVTQTRAWLSPNLTTDTTFLLQASLQQRGETVTIHQSTTVIVADPSVTATDLTVLGDSALQGVVTIGSAARQPNLAVDGTTSGPGSVTAVAGVQADGGTGLPANLIVRGETSLQTTTVNGDLRVTGALEAGRARPLFVSAQNADKRTQLWTVNDGGEIFTCWKPTTDPNSVWTTWVGCRNPSGKLLTLTSSQLSDGRPQLFAVTDQGLYSCWPPGDGTGTTPRSDWGTWWRFPTPPGPNVP
ncbi:hypothetical protein ACFW6R_29400 [Streptomyces albidoflavus]